MSDFGVQLDLFEPSDLGERSRVPAPTAARVVDSAPAFVELLREIEHAERVAFDTETTGIDMTRCELVGVSVCTRPGEGWYVPAGLDGEQWSMHGPESALLQQAFAASHGHLTAHNAKFDMGVLLRHGVRIERPVFDTLIAQFAIDPFLRGYGLKAMAKRHLGWDMTEIESLIGKRGQQISMRDVPIDMAAPYAAADADATWRLMDALEPNVRALNLGRLLYEIEFPLLSVLIDMEMAGVAVDLPYLKTLSDEMHARLHAIEEAIFQLVGRRFTVSSPQQISAVLYSMFGLQVNFTDFDALTSQDRTPSTRAYRLESLKDKHPIVPLVLEHRELSKLLGTYVDALPTLINPLTGRVHTHFNQGVVVTGRLSSSNPNLQNVPITTEIGRRVRQAFIGRENAKVISADYSQIELRVLAHLANDAGLKVAFARDEDIHATTAAAIYKVPLNAVTTEQRGFAKRINYGIAYGMSSYSLANSTNMTEQQAERFMAEYFKRFSGVKRWLDGTKRKMMTAHVVETLYGRRRPFENMNGKSRGEVRRAERLAVNHPVQGTAAEIVKLAMIQLHRKLRDGGYRTLLTLQVHDELVLDAPNDEADDMRQLLGDVMAHAVELAAPLKAEVGVGPNWDNVE